MIPPGEADRRDSARLQLVNDVIGLIHHYITKHAPVRSHEERRVLEMEIALGLLKGIQLENRSMMYRQEILTAEQELK